MRTYKFYVGVLNAWKHYASIWVREKTKVRTMTYLKHTRYKTSEKMSKFRENIMKHFQILFLVRTSGEKAAKA